MTNTRGKLAKGIMVGAEEKMSTELNAGADWEQSRRLVVHQHDMWSIQKRENELLKRKLDIAIEALKETWPGYTYAIAVNAFYRSKLNEIEEMK